MGRVYTRKLYTLDNSTFSLSQMSRAQACLKALPWRENALLRTFSLSQMSRDQPMEQREQKPNLFGLCRVVTEEDEVKLAWAMPWRELTTSREERLSLLRLSRNIVQTRAESSLLGYAECSRYSTKVNREGRRRSQNEGEANGYRNQ